MVEEIPPHDTRLTCGYITGDCGCCHRHLTMDELVAQFCGITASDPSIAEQYLQVSDNNLEQAVTLFLESGGAPIQDVSERSSANPPAVTRSPSPPPIRAPIEPVTERLIDPMSGMFDSFSQQHRATHRQNMPTGIFNQAFPGFQRSNNVRRQMYHGSDEDEDLVLGDEDEDDDEMFQNGNDNDEDLVEVDGSEFMRQTVGSSRLTATQSRLANLFRPPFEMMSPLSFDGAKQEAISSKKWIMVNIQDNSEFACQMLNRDLWANSTVKTTVSANFIFLQWSSDSDSGNEYCQFYPFSKYPHIAIIDPRTGEQLKVWSSIPGVEQFLEDVHEFLSAFSLEPGHRNPVVPARPKPVDHMTEEEQINFAMQQSLGGSPEGRSAAEAIEIEDSDEDDEDAMEYHDTSANAELRDEDILASIQASECPNEPEPGPDTTRIQIRTADGKRIVRRFNKSDTVAAIYAFVKKEVDSVGGHYFALTSERRKLLELRDSTLAEANLLNASVMVEILD